MRFVGKTPKATQEIAFNLHTAKIPYERDPDPDGAFVVADTETWSRHQQEILRIMTKRYGAEGSPKSPESKG